MAGVTWMGAPRGDDVTKNHWRPTLARLHLPPVKLHGAGPGFGGL
jgi:hypothetical protein